MKTTNIGNKSLSVSLITVILMTSLLSLNVRGNGFTDDKPFNNTEYITDKLFNNKLGTDFSDLLFEDDIEIENWMIDIKDDSWAQDSEDEMYLEEWMFDLNNKVWKSTDTEEEMVIEDWMGDPSGWLN